MKRPNKNVYFLFYLSCITPISKYTTHCLLSYIHYYIDIYMIKKYFVFFLFLHCYLKNNPYIWATNNILVEHKININ